MKKTTLLLAAAIVLAACGQTDPAEKFRDALPKSQAVQVGTYQSDTSGALSVQTAPLGDTPMAQSEYAYMSFLLATSINGGVGLTLSWVQFITVFPPTSCGEDSCTWGPALSDEGLNYWKLVVNHDGDHFDWAFSGQPASNPSAPWVDILFGAAYPGADRDHGRGTLTVDFDAQDGLDHGPAWTKTDYGRANIAYDNTGSPATVYVEFLGARNDDDPANVYFMNAVYSFEVASSGGQLQVAFENLSNADTVSLRTRWSPGGAGRGDAHAVASGGTVDYYASECWAGRSQDYIEVYDSKYPEIGPESACSPFSSASYADIVLP